jgi:trans-2,3-dihydro-3-hydroxyanthranilate isomerase
MEERRLELPTRNSYSSLIIQHSSLRTLSLPTCSTAYNLQMHLDYIVYDVFTSHPLTGNPLGVFPHAEGLGTEDMQAVTRELNLSECIFIGERSADWQDYHVRIFTPAQEMEFAGHPIVGCAAHLFRHQSADISQVNLHLPKASVNCWIDRSLAEPLVYFEPPPVSLGAVLDESHMVAALYGLSDDQLALDVSPAQVCRVGPRYLIVPVRTRGALERCKPNIALLESAGELHGFNQLTAFCLEPYNPGSVAATRMFAPQHGVYEDPATGSSAACLATYLSHHGLLGDSEQWSTLDQGYSMQRPSTIFMRMGRKADGASDLQIGGSVVEVIRGTLKF